MVPWKESTVITSSKTGREKWIEALGEGFRNQLEKVGTRRAYICRSHFPSGEVHGRRSVYSLPRLAADGDVADTSNLYFSEGDNGFEIIEDSRVADNEESFVLLNTDGEEDGEDSEESYGEQETDSSFVPESEESWSDDSEVEEGETSGNLEYAFVDLNCLIDSLKYCRQCHSEAIEAAVLKPSGYAVSVSRELSIRKQFLLEVESFNSLSTIYHPKSYYFHKNFPLRVQLTVLHWNSLKIEWYNNERHYTGLKAFYNKSNKEAVFKKRKSSGTHSWRRVVLEGVRSHQTQASTHNVPLSVSPDPNHMTDDYSSPNNYSSSDDDMI
ncbi:Protein CBG16179 [Caenorhabditis briggsae]|uniref:Protein CBG16179 n=1 Tax=Caenorhabditis briggsae TaxID=6238 RepID=A8XNY2_CAEBR|nr:Protein CBG16179 [Caenorhabditis briggsae]CAP34222.2 Protein CBG16179 [Caenorhabditis briggsae]